MGRLTATPRCRPECMLPCFPEEPSRRPHRDNTALYPPRAAKASPLVDRACSRCLDQPPLCPGVFSTRVLPSTALPPSPTAHQECGWTGLACPPSASFSRLQPRSCSFTTAEPTGDLCCCCCCRPGLRQRHSNTVTHRFPCLSSCPPARCPLPSSPPPPHHLALERGRFHCGRGGPEGAAAPRSTYRPT